MRRPFLLKRCSEVVKEPPTYFGSKAANFGVSPSLVGVITHDVPAEMTFLKSLKSSQKAVCKGHGMILESKVAGDATYSSTILAPAMLFKRPNGIKPKQVKCDVFVSDGKLYKGKLLKCDFHHNLALIKIRSGSRLKPVTLRALNDVSSINIDHYENPQADGESPLRFRHDSNLFKVQQGTKIRIVQCSFSPRFSVESVWGVFRASHLFHYACKELCYVECPGIGNNPIHSGAVINFSGEVLGIMLAGLAFLPSNFISRWWNDYKSKRLYRPWVGVEVVNLAEAQLSFLDELKNTFSDIGTGVIVTKVEKGTPARHSGIKLKDVIIECDGKPVQSKIEFFESMWENAKKCVELTILRASSGQPLRRSISIDETTETNYYRWTMPIPDVSYTSSDDDTGSDDD